jgi:hypothetical protein
MYTSAFKPWMEGEVSIAVTDFGSVLPTAVPSLDSSSLDSTASGVTSPGEVIIFAVKDRAAAESFMTGQLAGAKIAMTAQDYAGTKLYSSEAAHGAYALTDRDLLIGSVEGVKAALDTATKGSLADNANYQAAMKSVTGDSLARFYVDSGSYLTTLLSSSKSVLGAASASLPATLGLSSGDVPAWIAGSVRAESDRMVVDVVMPRVASGAIDNHLSRLAPALPGSTVGVFETHSLGAAVTKSLDSIAGASGSLGGIPGVGGTADTVKSIKDALALFGGIDWIGDGVAVVTKDGSTYGGGLVVEATDAATAKSKAAMINTVTAFAGGALKMASRSETYKGVAITVISIPSGSDGAPVEIAVAAKDNLLVAGYTDSFVKAVVDTTSATSLASAPDYSAVMAAAGASNNSSFYVNIPALEDQIGLALVGSTSSPWTQDYKPYFDHLGGIGYSVVDGNTVTTRLVVTAK